MIEDDEEEEGDESIEYSEEDENEEDIDLTDNYDLRDDWIQHQKYLKYMESASFLWDQFTSGNALQKNMKKKE